VYGPVSIQTPNTIAYYTNVVGQPYGSTPMLIVITNTVYTLLTYYTNTYANLTIITNSYQPNSSAQLVTVTVGIPIGQSYGSPLVTNTSYQTITLTSVPSGDYYISTNPCGNKIFYQLPYTNVVATTNFIAAASNSAGFFYSQSIVTYSTNHAYWAAPIICSGGGAVGVTNSTGLYQGLGKLQFVQANYDSLIGISFQPITNVYTAVFVTNNQPIVQTFQRVVTGPDFVFSASDLVTGPSGALAIPWFARTLPSFLTDSNYAGLAGPGVINPGGSVGSSITIAFDKSVPVYENFPPYNQGTNSSVNYNHYWLYGSFDGTTNTPIVYPDVSSTAKLDAATLIQVSPNSPGGLPPGNSNMVYSATFSVLGGQSPYNWSLLAGQLPDGLVGPPTSPLSVTNSVISGTPTRRGTYYFTIQMNDSSPSVNTLNLDYSITIN
jgi:hypothetical protein